MRENCSKKEQSFLLEINIFFLQREKRKLSEGKCLKEKERLSLKRDKDEENFLSLNIKKKISCPLSKNKTRLSLLFKRKKKAFLF